MKPTEKTSKTKSLDSELNTMILAGDILGAFEKYYADDIVMQENDDEPTLGKDANRVREQAFVASIKEFHDAKLVTVAQEGDTTFSQWANDLTLEGVGRVQSSQVAIRRWKDGKIIHERFYHQGY